MLVRRGWKHRGLSEQLGGDGAAGSQLLIPNVGAGLAVVVHADGRSRFGEAEYLVR